MRTVLFFIFVSVALPAIACHWDGELDKNALPVMVDCPKEVMQFIKREHSCRVAITKKSKQPAYCEGMVEERAKLYRDNVNDSTVYQAVSNWLASGLSYKLRP